MYQRFLKRTLDLFGAAFLLVFFAPVMAMCYTAILIAMGRPVFFLQRRPGLDGKVFTIFKFRTMLSETGPNGRVLTESQRTTRLGLLLRATSLDELPQLLNILRGQMSFIGPRPLLERYLSFYTEREQSRHSVRPGLTGWAQVRGRNDVAWNQRLELDAWYAQNVTFRLDALIFWQTVRVVLAREGVREDPGTVMRALDEERRQAA
jgi:lipopolysaccharide/colanic/teichoic acid biosynthesis glycosyltransferase